MGRYVPMSAKSTPSRQCLDCPADISHHHRNSPRCVECQAERERRRQRSPAYRQQVNERRRAPEYRDREVQRARERRHIDPVYRERRNARMRKLRADPVYGQQRRDRERLRERERLSKPAARAHKQAWRRRWQRGRYQTDPLFRRQRAAQNRRRLLLRGGAGLRKHISQLLARDGAVCGICKCPLPTDRSQWHVDHIVPFSLGGPNSLHNLRLAHARCNEARGNRIEPHTQYALPV